MYGLDTRFATYLDEFQQFCITTAVYPGVGNNLAYTVLGLLGEWGEVERSVTWNQVESELGDCFWYVATTAHELSASLSTIVSLAFNRNRLNFDRTAIYELAQIVKRRVRDNKIDFDVAEEMLALTVCLLVDKLMQSPSFYKTSPEDAIEIVTRRVQAKLKSRQTRGVIHGSGDDR